MNRPRAGGGAASKKQKVTGDSQPPRTLRQRAEEMARTSPTNIAGMTAEDVQRLVQELQIHQMELELQNEDLRAAQLELAESRDRYSDLYEFAPVGYLALDKDGKILEANLTAATMLGVQRQDLLRSNISAFVARKSQDALYLHSQAVFASRIKQTSEMELVKAGGTPIWIHLESIAYEAAENLHWRAALVDVSGRKQAEESMHQLNLTLEHRVADQTREVRLLADALSHLGEGVVITSDHLDWPGPRILFANEAICRISGYATDELVGQTPRILQGGETDRETLNHVRRQLSAGRSCMVELVNYRKDGTPYDAELFVTPLFDAQGHRTNFVSIHRDISTRKQGEKARRDSEERMRTILNTATDAIITIDQRGIITGINPATERIFGYSRKELVGQNVSMLMPPPYRDEHDGYIARFVKTGQPRIIGIGREVVGRRKDGSTFPVDLAVSQVDHLGLFTGFVRDISFRKELEKQVLEASVEEQRRIGQELHDGTGQELTALSLFAGTLLDLLNAAPQKSTGQASTWLLEEAKLLQLRQIADRLSRGLVEANHHVQQLSHGIMPVQIEAEGLRFALENLAVATDAQQKISCRFDSPVPVAVADNTTATQLYRIAQEAVNNALRHSRADQICISLSRDNGEIILCVSDNGIGFDTESIRPGYSGGPQGFGLRIMNYRAGMIGGTLYVTRRDEGGMLVKCVIPRGGVVYSE